MSSASSSVRSSPYGSNSDLNDEDIYMEKPIKKSRSKKAAGSDYDEVEQTIHKAQQDAGEFTQDYIKFRTETQNHAKRIKDLIALAQESRVRIDALLGKRTRTRSDTEDNYRTSVVKRGSIEYDSDERSNRRGSDDRRVTRDADRDRSHVQSERNRRGSNEQMMIDIDRRESTGQVITCTNPSAIIEVGSVSLSTNKMMDTNGHAQGNKTVLQHKMVESKAAININGSPKLAKKPFKFGTVSLQVKIED